MQALLTWLDRAWAFWHSRHDRALLRFILLVVVLVVGRRGMGDDEHTIPRLALSCSHCWGHIVMMASSGFDVSYRGLPWPISKYTVMHNAKGRKRFTKGSREAQQTDRVSDRFIQ